LTPAKRPQIRPKPDKTTRRPALEPEHDCSYCPRLAAFRSDIRAKQADWFNAPVPSYGPADARLLIVGLAPGLKGANRTGRPFTGDFAGDLLYVTLISFGFASGVYQGRADDGLKLVDCRITNAVRCVPPENKPTPEEIKTCRPFLDETITSAKALTAIVALGRIAHDSVVQSLGRKRSELPFAHGREHVLETIGTSGLTLFDSYHCSRYNTNTGVLTAEMFQSVFARVRMKLDSSANSPRR
jgi:uracil-DNA glycosylase family 4